VTRNNLAALSVGTGSVIPWNPSANATVRAIAISGSTIFAGGDFTSFGSGPHPITRNYLASLDAVSGAVTDWNPNAGNTVHALAVVTGPTTVVYVGGDFSTIGGQMRSYVASLTADTNFASVWNPNSNGNVYALAASGSTIYVGGLFSMIGGQGRGEIAALNAGGSGTATSWNPDAAAGGGVSALAVSGGAVYVGGDFLGFGLVTPIFRNRIAAIDALSGAITPWNPNANSTVAALAVSGSKIYAGGDFTTIGGQGRNRIASLDAVSGLANAWNPNTNGLVRSFALAGSTAYAAGEFTSVGGRPYSGIAAFDLLGDMNCDGKLNGMDIGPFVQAMLDPPAYVVAQPCCLATNADMDLSGTADTADIPPFVAVLVP
jgi:hypothetical protein